MTTQSCKTTRVPRLLRAALAAVVTMAGCETFSAKVRKDPVTSTPVRIVQSNDDGDESFEADAAIAPQQRAMSPRPRDIVAGLDHSDPVDTPQVNVYGEFDGFQRTVAQRTVGAIGFQQHTFLDDGYDSDVAVDPSAKWLVYASTHHSMHADVYLQRTDGSSVTQLTDDAGDEANPTFSPDGKTIAFASTRAGNWDIYTMDPDGRNVIQVTSGLGQDLHPSFSPDGTRLVYCSGGGRSGGGLVSESARGRNADGGAT